MGTEVIPKSEEAVPAEAPTAVESQIIRQIEYYFGNYNLSRDKFLREQLKLDDGWVPLETMVKFNRLKKLSEDFSVIIEALKKSPKQLMEVSDDCTKIRRREAAPLTEDHDKRQEELDTRTLYVKGFKKTNTLDELLDYFKEHNVEHVYMRRRMNLNNKPFKGSVFVTFETKDDAEKFLNTKGLKYGGTELLKEWRPDYLKRKDEYYDNLKAEKQKKMLEKAGVVKEDKTNGESKVPEIDIVPGCLLKICNLDENITREDIKEVFEPHGTVVYVDYSKGKPSAVLRFDTGVAKSALEKVLADGEKVKIGSSEASVSVIEGDEEKEYWKNIAVSRAQNRAKFHKGNRNFGNKRKFKQWGNRQRGRNDDKDDESAETPQKRVKREDPEESTEKESSSMEISEAKNDAPEVKEEIKSES